jgi:hypothetical protein
MCLLGRSRARLILGEKLKLQAVVALRIVVGIFFTRARLFNILRDKSGGRNSMGNLMLTATLICKVHHTDLRFITMIRQTHSL